MRRQISRIDKNFGLYCFHFQLILEDLALTIDYIVNRARLVCFKISLLEWPDFRNNRVLESARISRFWLGSCLTAGDDKISVGFMVNYYNGTFFIVVERF